MRDATDVTRFTRVRAFTLPRNLVSVFDPKRTLAKTSMGADLAEASMGTKKGAPQSEAPFHATNRKRQAAGAAPPLNRSIQPALRPHWAVS